MSEGLKQKISKIATKTQYSLCQKECIHTSEDCKRCRKTTLLRKDIVLGLLDEATKQIQELMVVADLEHTHPSTEFWRGWNKAVDRVLAVLEGEKK